MSSSYVSMSSMLSLQGSLALAALLSDEVDDDVVSLASYDSELSSTTSTSLSSTTSTSTTSSTESSTSTSTSTTSSTSSTSSSWFSTRLVTAPLAALARALPVTKSVPSGLTASASLASILAANTPVVEVEPVEDESTWWPVPEEAWPVWRPRPANWVPTPALTYVHVCGPPPPTPLSWWVYKFSARRRRAYQIADWHYSRQPTFSGGEEQ